MLAPRWTRAGYKGRLKDAVIKSVNKEEDENKKKEDEEDKKDGGEEEEDKEDEGEVEVSVLLTSGDQHIGENSDDENLVMDDGFGES